MKLDHFFKETFR